MRLPHEHAEESSAYRGGPVEKIHRVSEGWSCLAGTEGCLG